MTPHSTATNDLRSIPAFRVSSIIDALADVGIEGHRDAVVRASDKFLHVASRTTRRSHRQWSADEIDLLVTAFRLRHGTGLIWPRIAEMFDDNRPIDDQLHDEIEQIRGEIDDLEARCAASEALLRDIKDGRTYVTTDELESESSTAA